MEPISGISVSGTSLVRANDYLDRVDDGIQSKLVDSIDNSSEATSSFSDMLGGAVNNLLQAQNDAGKATLDLTAGRRDDIANVMIEVQKAGISLQLGLEIRNKVIDAYHEVMRMTV